MSGGVDGIIIETMSAIEEVSAAIRAARAAGAPFVIASLAFDRLPNGGKLHMQSLSALAHFDFNQAGAYAGS